MLLFLSKAVIAAHKLTGNSHNVAVSGRNGVHAGEHVENGLVIYIIIAADNLYRGRAVAHPAVIAQLAVGLAMILARWMWMGYLWRLPSPGSLTSPPEQIMCWR